METGRAQETIHKALNNGGGMLPEAGRKDTHVLSWEPNCCLW